MNKEDKIFFNKLIDALYKNELVPSSKIYSVLLEKYPSSKGLKKLVDEYLRDQESYQIHTQERKNNKSSNSIIAFYEGDIYQMDLLDMSKFAKYNKNYAYILSVIDVYSRYGWAIPLKTKEAEGVKNALSEIFKSAPPTNLTSDNGKEFKNNILQSYLKDNGINQYFADPGDHNRLGIIERFNRTIRIFCERVFALNNNWNWIDYIDKLTKTYNNIPHAITKQTPAEVFSGKKYPKNRVNFSISNLNVNDYVRVKTPKNIFAKGTAPKWSREVYQIVATVGRKYKLDGFEDKRFAESDLQKVTKSTNINIVPESRDELTRKKRLEQEFRREDIKQENIISRARSTRFKGTYTK